MGFLEQLLAIARVTFAESIRQHVVAVIALAGTVLLVLANPLSTFTMDDDQRMLLEIGMSTIFLGGLLLAALLATNVLTREIENKTVLTVVSKPVPRPVLLVGKYVGVLGAILLCYCFLASVFMLVARHGTMPTVATPYQVPVLTFGILAAVAGLSFAVFANYFYGWSFGATLVGVGTPLLLLAFALSLPFKHDWSTPGSLLPATGMAPESTFDFVVKNLSLEMWKTIAFGGLALAILTAIAVALSTRLGLVLTLVFTLGIFVAGLLSDWIFARRIATLQKAFAAGDPAMQHWWDAEHLTYGICRVGQAIVPNFQVFWLVDAVNQKKPINLSIWTDGSLGLQYGASVLLYGFLLIAMALAVGVFLLQRREVG